MKRIEADTLEIAYLNASKEFTCSITELDINIIQNSSSGFLGMFRKTAIIEVTKKGTHKQDRVPKHKKERNNRQDRQGNKEPETKKSELNSEDKRKTHKQKRAGKVKEKDQTISRNKQIKTKKSAEIQKPRREPKKQIPRIAIEKAVSEIRDDINRLFKQSCFEMDEVKVSQYNDDTILLEFGGEDSALLIGKEGYRYKALSYILYNWINIKYGVNIRLEIAEFLKNQEEMIGKYLVPVIERVRSNGRGQTKVLDGVLIKIALEKLRAEFPEKYVGIKSARSGGRFIVINDFNRKSK